MAARAVDSEEEPLTTSNRSQSPRKAGLRRPVAAPSRYSASDELLRKSRRQTGRRKNYNEDGDDDDGESDEENRRPRVRQRAAAAAAAIAAARDDDDSSGSDDSDSEPHTRNVPTTTSRGRICKPNPRII